jgi:hypothetical protein
VVFSNCAKRYAVTGAFICFVFSLETFIVFHMMASVEMEMRAQFYGSFAIIFEIPGN